MNLVAYNRAAHYGLLEAWWLERAHEPEGPDALPGGGRPGHGVFAMERSRTGADVPLACGFVYATGTQLWLGPHYLTVNPALHGIEGGKELGDAALDAVVRALELHVADHGGGALHTFTDQPAVIARARRHGYALRGRWPMLGKWIAPAETTVTSAADGKGSP